VCFALIVALIQANELLISTIEGHHIVVLHANVTKDEVKRHVLRHGVTTTFTYEIADTYKAYSAYLTAEQLRRITSSSEVNYVEKDQMMHASDECITQSDAIWGLNRISEKEPLLTGDYNYASLAGEGAEVFVIDTGILITHKEFDANRASWGANYVDTRNTDCNGHGTHVAGTVAGTLYGVAKKSTVTAVKVLSCSGSGTNSGVIKGVQYASDPANRKNKYAIANMSLGGGFSKALNDAIAAGVRAGVTMVVAAGNDDDNACFYSPASEPSALTVGATVVEDEERAQVDERTTFSNFGSCVKIFAPGQSIKAAWYTSNTATNTISGTSMASPHVAGAAALYLAANSANGSPKVVEAFLKDGAVPDLIDLVCRTSDCLNTPNLLLHTAC